MAPTRRPGAHRTCSTTSGSGPRMTRASPGSSPTGSPQTEMIPFKEQLTDQQIWQLVAYLKQQGANLKPRPTFVRRPRRTGDQEREADVQDRADRARHRDAVGPRVSARRPPARDRACRQAANHPEGQVRHRRDRDRHAQGLGAPGRRLPRRRGASAVREERLDLPGVLRAGPELHAAACAAGGRRAAGAARDAAGEAPQTPSIPSMTTIVRGKINAKNEWTDQQVLFRAPPDQFTTNNSHYGSRFIFDRQGHLFYTLGERGVMENAQDLSKPTRQDPPRQRRRLGAEGQPVRRQGRRAADDLELRPSQSAGPGVGSGDRQAVGVGARPAGRRRDQHHRAGPELRLGRDHDGRAARHHQAHASRAWSSRSSTTRRRSRRAAWSSTPATGIRSGRTTCSSARSPASSCAAWRSSGDKVTHQEVLFNQFGRVHDVDHRARRPTLRDACSCPGRSLSASTPGSVARLVPVESR